MRKKFFVLFIVIVLLLSISGTTTAKSNKINILREDGSIITGIYEIKNGIVKELSIAEYNDILDQSSKNKAILKKLEKNTKPATEDPVIIPMSWGYATIYNEEGHLTYLNGFRRARVSTVLYNGTSNPSNKSLSCSMTDYYTINVGLTTAEWLAVKFGASITYHASSTMTETNTLTISPGMYGWFEFSPYTQGSWGVVETYIVDDFGNYWLNSESDAYYTSPQEVSGFLDGIFYAIERSSPPS